MNRYSLWKYIVIAVALLLGAMYTLPNFFGESPAVQVSSGKPTIKVDTALLARIETILKDAKLETSGVFFDTVGLECNGACSVSRHRHSAAGQGRYPASAESECRRPGLHRRAEPDLEHALLAEGGACAADVPRPRPARRRALPAAGRHAGGGRQTPRDLQFRHPHAAARKEHPSLRHHQVADRDRDQVPRRRDPRPCGGPDSRPRSAS